MDSSLSFSVSQFYGNRRRKRKKDTETLQEKQMKLPVAYPHRIFSPTNCWKIFYRQNEAFKWSRKTAEDVLVFAFESADGDPESVTGKRRYLVTSLEVFWHYYSCLEASRRHHYEIIPEGCPCRLYFDLEFLKGVNPGRDGDKMVEILVQYVCMWLQTVFGLSCGRSDIIELDASTEKKFSRHLVFHLPGAVFENCVTAGYFVRYIFGLLRTFIRLQSGSQESTLNSWNSDKICDAHTISGWAVSPLKAPRSPQTLPVDNFGFDETVDEEELISLAQKWEEAASCERRAISSIDGREGTNSGVSSLNVGDGTNSGFSSLNVREGTDGDVSSLNVGDGTNSGVSSLNVRGETNSGVCSLNVGYGTNSGVSSLYVGDGTNSGVSSLYVGDGTNSGVSSLYVGDGTNSGVSSLYVGDGTNSESKHIEDREKISDQCTCLSSSSLTPDMYSSAATEEVVCTDVESSHLDMMRMCGQFSLDDLKSLLVNNHHGSQALFCDLGVYTKNRNFRLFLSSKLHKNNPLVVSTRNQFQPDRAVNSVVSEKAFFYASLVSYRSETSHVRVLQFECQEKTAGRLKGMPSSGGLGVSDPGITDTEDSFEGFSCSSPYPEIDWFIESLSSSHGCRGRVRHWTFFKSSDTLLYDLVGCRWCGNVQREHRSNNIMYVVDLRRKVFYQKCHDPDCQTAGYRSQAREIPHQLLPSAFPESEFNDDILEGGTHEDSSHGEDNFLLAAVEDFEQRVALLMDQELPEVTADDDSDVWQLDDDAAMVAAAEQAELDFGLGSFI